MFLVIDSYVDVGSCESYLHFLASKDNPLDIRSIFRSWSHFSRKLCFKIV